MLRQMLRFAAVGLVNTGVGLAAIYAAMLALDVGPAPANAIGYAIGFAVGFTLNRRWTFDCNERAAIVLPKYVLAVAICYGLNLGTVMAAISYLDHNPFLAQALGVLVYTCSLFTISRQLVFRSARPFPARGSV